MKGRPRGQKLRGNQSQGLVASQPGSYVPHGTVAKKFRFLATAAMNSTISGSCLLNILHHCATTTTSYPLYGAVKLLKVEMFGAPVQAGLYSEATLKFLSHRTLPKTFEDTGTVQVPAHVVGRPDPASDVGRWVSFLDTAAEQQQPMFNLIGGAGTTIDITLECQMFDQTLVGTHVLTVAAGAAGFLYYNALDNTATNAATVGNNNILAIGQVSALLAFG